MWSVSYTHLKDAELYKSSIPSQYGGRIASVLNITSKEANKEKFTGSAGIGLVTSKLNLEIPIIKEKTSLCLLYTSYHCRAPRGHRRDKP